MDTNEKQNSRPASQLQPASEGEIVLYQPDNNIRLEVQLDPDSQTVWLSQAQIGQLYGKAKTPSGRISSLRVPNQLLNKTLIPHSMRNLNLKPLET